MIAFTESNRHLIPAKRDRHFPLHLTKIASSNLIPAKRDRPLNIQNIMIA